MGGRSPAAAGEGRMFCQTLLPKDYRVVWTNAGKAEAYDSAGRSQGSGPGNPYHVQFGKHVIQIEPAVRAIERYS